jgi:type I restriction enzyme R subunit
VLVEGHLPYGYESTGDETWFTCRMDPEPTARRVFWIHRPETFAREIDDHLDHGGGTLRARIRDLDLNARTIKFVRG